MVNSYKIVCGCAMWDVVAGDVVVVCPGGFEWWDGLSQSSVLLHA